MATEAKLTFYVSEQLVKEIREARAWARKLYRQTQEQAAYIKRLEAERDNPGLYFANAAADKMHNEIMDGDK
jgi:hypothetical protein